MNDHLNPFYRFPLFLCMMDLPLLFFFLFIDLQMDKPKLPSIKFLLKGSSNNEKYRQVTVYKIEVPPPPHCMIHEPKLHKRTNSASLLETKISLIDRIEPSRTITVHHGRYICQYCCKTFSRPSSLQVHIYSHTGEKPFECTECGKPFSVQSNMKRHLKTHKSLQ